MTAGITEALLFVYWMCAGEEAEEEGQEQDNTQKNIVPFATAE